MQKNTLVFIKKPLAMEVIGIFFSFSHFFFTQEMFQFNDLRLWVDSCISLVTAIPSRNEDQIVRYLSILDFKIFATLYK